MTAPRRNPNWAMPTAPRGTSDSRGASTAFVTQGGAGPRKVLTAATTYHVSTAGSNLSDGSSGSPWATFAHAMLVITGQIDFAGQTVTLQVDGGSGNYTEQLSVTAWTGGGAFVFDGGGKTINTTSNHAVLVSGALPGIFTLQNVTLKTTTSGDCLRMTHAGEVDLGSSVTFDACATVHIRNNTPGAFFKALANYTISSGAVAHITQTAGEMIIEGITITLSGTPAFSTNFVGVFSGPIFIDGNTFSGSATGQMFTIAGAGVIVTGGKPNAVGAYLPGSSVGVNNGGAWQYS